MKKFIIALVILVIAGLGIYFGTKKAPSREVPDNGSSQTVNPVSAATTTAANPQANGPEQVIGKSVQGRDIIAYHFGTGPTEILFVGGLHGGYEWNTSLVAFQMVDYLRKNPSAVPANERITVIPAANPDGLALVTGTSSLFSASQVSPSQSVQIAGRFNANTVDLNRNFDCDWKSSGVWQSKTVSGGTAAFSEPETLAIKNYVDAHLPTAAVVWYSSAGGVFASSCGGAVTAETSALAKAFGNAAGYPSFQDFDSYQVTGDMVNWLAKMNIPGISVLLTNHTDTEWTKNKAGIDAVLKRYAK